MPPTVKDYVNSLEHCHYCGCITVCEVAGNRVLGRCGVNYRFDYDKKGFDYAPLYKCRDRDACAGRKSPLDQAYNYSREVKNVHPNR